MKVLVAGATGFVAGTLVPRLLAGGHEVIALGHDGARLRRFPGAQPMVVDLRRPDLGDALPDDVDAVIHLAQANVPFPAGAADLFAVNVGSVQQLLEYARRRGVRRFVYASTGSVYGGGDRPWKESDPPLGAGYYAATRQAAERLVVAYGDLLPYVVLRTITPYGPGQRNRLVPGLIGRVRNGQAVTLREGGRPRMNPVFDAHVAEVFAQALDVSGNQVVNLGGDEVLSVREMAEVIGRELGTAPRFEDAPGASGGDVVADVTRLRQVFRLPDRLTPFAAGIRAMLDAEASPGGTDAGNGRGAG
jgi:nucleoside-diphosphate-sugar epimerase